MKKIFRLGVSMCIVLTFLATITGTVFAASKTTVVLDGQVSVYDELGTGKGNADTYTITAKGGILSKKTNTITIENISEEKATISFDYSMAGGYSPLTIDGVEVAASGNYSKELDPGAQMISIVMTANGGYKTATLTLNDIKYEPMAESADITVLFDSECGTVTANGVNVENEEVVKVEKAGAEFVATPINGAKFLAWVEEDGEEDGKVISTATSYTQSSAKDKTVKALFIKKTAYFSVFTSSEYIFDDLNEAVKKGNTVVLKCDGTLGAGKYTIPSGVTLLIPFDDANTMYTNEPVGVNQSAGTGLGILGQGDLKANYQQPVAYRTLIMDEGTEIIINGSLNLSAKHYAGDTVSPYPTGGAPTGSVGFIKMNKNSSITVNDGGKLYAWGYITGEGNVTAKSGAEVYEYFQFADFRGGDQTSAMTTGSEKSYGVFPLSQYYVQNIEAPLTIESGATETTYTSIFVSTLVQGSGVKFFGSGENNKGMFNLTSGYVTKRYDGENDRLIVDLYGKMSVDPLNLSIASYKIDSSKYELPITNNITINVKEGSEIVINQNIALLPGAQIKIEEGATGKLSNGILAYIYDADEWGGYCSSANKKLCPLYYAPGKIKTRTEADLVDGAVILNGTFDASEGYVYTTQSGANIYSEGTGIVKMKTGLATNTYQVVQDYPNPATYKEIGVTTAKLKNGDGEYLEYDGKHTEFYYADGLWNPTHTFENYVCECGEEKRVTRTNYSIADGDITITSELTMEIPSSSTIIIATYDSTDKLLNSKSFLKDELESVTFSNKDVDKIRVFSWDGFNTIEPIALVEEKTVQQ